MPVVRDFKNYSYKPERIERCGKKLGKELYWKLYAIENTLRVVIHSVLTVQIGPQWWAIAVSPRVVAQAQRFRASYVANPKHASPGAHDIYLLFLSDLAEILRAQSNLFLPVIADTNKWIATLDSIRLPRNLVGHMNFPNAFDRSTVDIAYTGLPSLMSNLIKQGIPIVVPK